jgi:hypothetical protein
LICGEILVRELICGNEIEMEMEMKRRDYEH